MKIGDFLMQANSQAEAERLASLRSYQILDTLPERDFDEIVETAASICDTEIALVSLVDENRQWFKARHGLTDTETARDISICSHAILQKNIFVIPDTFDDVRFSDNPLVTDVPNIRFYAGVPLINSEGHALGTLCVIDSKPGELSGEQEKALCTLARQVVTQFEFRKTKSELTETISKSRKAELELRESEEFKTRLIEGSHDCIKVLDLDGRLVSMNEGGMQILEICDFASVCGSEWVEFWNGEDKQAAVFAVKAARGGGFGRFVGYCPSFNGKPMWWDVIVNPILDRTGKPEKLLALSRDITERKKAEQMLQNIVAGTAKVTGSKFFQVLVERVCLALEVKFAFVTECRNRSKTRVRTLAYWKRESLAENIEFDIAKTPCENVLKGEVCHYASALQELFPEDLGLIELSAESYIGLPLLDDEGEIIGHLAVIDDETIEDISKYLPVLKVFAARAGAELERHHAEEELHRALKEVEDLKNRLYAENIYLQEEIHEHHNFEEIIGDSPALLEVLQKLEMVAPTDATVLVTGETGTGKELIARAVHNFSRRKNRPLVKVNCAAISSGLVESELFGHTKGAFTGAFDKRIGRFELANGGTIFLDEVGELPLETQVKILRVLQEGEFEPVGSSKTIKVDVRVIAATNRNLAEEIKASKFRSDLYYRLNVFPLHVPSLRERRDDIPSLVIFFLDRFAKKFGKSIEGVSEEVMKCLIEYDWFGNVRELQNVVERAVVLAPLTAKFLQSEMIPVLSMGNGHSGSVEDQSEFAASSDKSTTKNAADSLQSVQRQHILSVLEKSHWVIEGDNGAAQVLNIHPNTLRSRMKKLGIARPSK